MMPSTSPLTTAPKAAPRTRPALTVYHELDPGLYSVTSKTFVGRVYSMLGLRNIADAADRTGSGYPQLSAVYVVSADPQLIVLADSACCGQSAVTVRKRVGWSTIAAVRKGGVVAVNDDIASRWGPRIVDFVRDIAKRLQEVWGQPVVLMNLPISPTTALSLIFSHPV